MAHYGAGKLACNTVLKDQDKAYTKASVHWLGNVVTADGSEYFVVIRKGNGVDIARAFGLPFAPISTTENLRKQLAALSAYKPELETAAAANIKAVRASSKKLAELEQRIGENAASDEAEALVKEREAEIQRNCELVEKHAKTWDTYLDALYAYNTAALLFGLPGLKVLNPLEVSA